MSDPSHSRYTDPLVERYASPQMSAVFSPRFKFETWRRLWLYLAEEEKRLGLPVSDEAISEMRAHLADIDFDAAARQETELRHDVMAHVKTFAAAAPAAAGIIHWGATSAYVADNGDLIQMKAALEILERRVASFLQRLRDFAFAHRDLPCLAWTHYQPAQPTTVGKRACLWAQEFLWDLQEIRRVRENLRFLGAKGATGTQASFLELFRGDSKKAEDLDSAIARRAGFVRRQIIAGQTYSRKQDAFVLAALSGLAQSAHKCATDIRLLQHDGEIEEPFEKHQIGSSAMPYKRNPIRAERVCAIARHVIALALDPALTAATQWLERSLDDSANRRLSLGPAFLSCDAIALILNDIFAGLEVHPEVIARHLEAEIPFLATENVLMEEVRRGGNRQELHEVIRVAAREAMAQRQRGEKPDLFGALAGNSAFRMTRPEMESAARRKLAGRSAEQVEIFLREELDPALEGVTVPSAEPLRV